MLKQIELPDGTSRHFGRKRPLATAPRLKLKNYLLKSMPAPPPACGYTKLAQPQTHQMYENDRLGCHDAATEVLTEKGWQQWPSYDGKSLLGTMNQITGMLEFQAPLALQRYEYDGPMHFADHKSLDFGLTPEHRMFNRPYVIPSPYVPGGAAYGEYQFDTVSTLGTRVALPASTTGFLGTTLRSLQIGRRIWNGDDLVRLLALVLSDGFVAGGETNRDRISFCCFRPDRLEMVSSFAFSIEAKEFQSRPGVWVLRDECLAEWIRVNCYAGAEQKSQFKRIPDLIKVSSQGQIGTFLRYFGDQHVTDDGTRQFYSGSRRMIDDLQDLLLRTGRRGEIYSRPQRDGGYNIRGREIKAIEGHLDITLHEWQERENGGVTLQRLSRKPTMVIDHYKGEVFCATVPNSTLITRRNDQILISGNCCVEAAVAHAIGIFGAQNGARWIFSNDQITAMYGTMAGYISGDPSTDNGTDIGTALSIWQKPGVPGPGGTHLIQGSLAVDATNPEEVRTAIWLFENVLLGLELPDAWVNPFPSDNGFVWDVAGAPDPSNGHCLIGAAYSPAGITVATWALLGLMTNAALEEYCAPRHGGELYAVLSKDIINRAQQRAPNGFAWNALLADFNSLA